MDILQNAQYNIAPFQRFEIPLNVDRTQGVFFPQFAGQTLYVEQADFPVLMGLTNQDASLNQSAFAFNGKQFAGGFRGISLKHPLISGNNAADIPKLVLYVGARAGFEYKNDSAFPLGLPSTYRTITATGVLLNLGVYVPPGARRLDRLSLSVAHTTVTSASWLAFGPKDFTVGQAVWAGLTSPETALVYPATLMGGLLKPLQVIAGNMILEEFNLLLPSWVPGGELQLSVVGTGMTIAGFVAQFS